MIPSIIDTQLRDGVRDYLRTTFPVTTNLFSQIIEDLVTDQDRMFKVPYLSLGLHYLQGDAGPDVIPDIPLKFPPYLHQQKAFERLRGDECRSTIVATGTGSGKTECFLLPILEHCLTQRRENVSGIKAIIIYPMNALAQDQARRIAETIWKNPNLKGQVSAGLYVGGKQQSPYKVMGDNHVITDRETMRLRPPDILLTNYKMLDYMLSRPNDRGVWSQNGAGTLRYLVVDELHTFDGAQGTDLACLIRRLKYRLEADRKQLCCVGTSATLGGPEGLTDLREYAAKVFGEEFDAESVITESREDYTNFLHGSFVARSFDIPNEDNLNMMGPSNFSTVDDYLRKQTALWFGDRVTIDDTSGGKWTETLGSELKTHPLFRTILQILDGKIVSEDMLLRHLKGTFREFASGSLQYHRMLLQSLTALISTARTLSTTGPEPKLVPFVQVRYQSWLREMRRMVASVGEQPRLEFAADLTDTELQTHLPVVHCRECGSTGWAGLKKQNEDKVQSTLVEFYSGYFAKNPSPNICYLFPDAENLETGDEAGFYAAVCPACLRLTSPDKTSCGDCGNTELVKVYLPNNRKRAARGFKSSHNCPVCKGRDSLVLIGARSASLSSVMINQLFSSPYNDDKKLITFSDNVQDASHRAGFYGARTWRFNFRTALQQCLDSLDENPTIQELPGIFCEYWKKKKSTAEYVATFLPPDMAWQEEFVSLLEKGKTDFTPAFITGIDKRLSWEIYSEYGYSSRVGRTLEKAGCSVVRMNFDLTESALGNLAMKLENDIGTLRGNVTTSRLRQFIIGLHRRLVMRGALYQDVLKQYVEYQGNIYYVNRIPWMRKFGYGIPSPAFPSTATGHESRFDKVSSRPDKPTTWFSYWLLKHFGNNSFDILNYFQDFYQILFTWLMENNLLIEFKVKDDKVWALNSKTNSIDRSVELHRCDKCGYRVAAASIENSYWVGMPCFKQGCDGHFATFNYDRDYYAHLYRHGDIQRLFPREHTGLLTREEREPLETLFKTKKQDAKSWYPNLLSCTPTLEMGIDIGDLSSVLLCSVPPEQAAYLQRIGRAGRTDGNSACTTIAAGVPHDLYFFAEPGEMIQGTVKTPGVYLDASAVLERQLTAFCLDQWVRHTPDAAVPPKISAILSRIAKNSAQGFPFTLFEYVNNNQAGLESAFTDQFTGMLSSETKEHIHDFLFGTEEFPSLERKILNGLANILDERKSLERQRNLLSSRILRMKDDPGTDPDELDDLTLERDAFNELISKIRFDSFATPFDESTKDLREEAIRRLALSLDCPPELLLGMGGANHWSAWLVRDEVVQVHVAPRLDLLCDGLSHFYRAVKEQQGDPRAQDYVLKADVSHLVQRPNRLADASQLHTAGVLSDAALREAGGFEDTDAPTTEEQAIKLAIGVAQGNAQLVDNLAELYGYFKNLLDGTPETGPPEP
ncbi:MAG: DEAD/DEAH box helicase, partial [Anaerolineales bacterium]